MKNNIIYLRPEQNMQTTTDAGGWVRLEAERAFGLIDSLLILGLGGGHFTPDSNASKLPVCSYFSRATETFC